MRPLVTEFIGLHSLAATKPVSSHGDWEFILGNDGTISAEPHAVYVKEGEDKPTISHAQRRIGRIFRNYGLRKQPLIGQHHAVIRKYSASVRSAVNNAKNGNFKLVDYHLASANDLAEAARLQRNPRFETKLYKIAFKKQVDDILTNIIIQPAYSADERISITEEIAKLEELAKTYGIEKSARKVLDEFEEYAYRPEVIDFYIEYAATILVEGNVLAADNVFRNLVHHYAAISQYQTQESDSRVTKEELTELHARLRQKLYSPENVNAAVSAICVKTREFIRENLSLNFQAAVKEIEYLARYCGYSLRVNRVEELIFTREFFTTLLIDLVSRSIESGYLDNASYQSIFELRKELYPDLNDWPKDLASLVYMRENIPTIIENIKNKHMYNPLPYLVRMQALQTDANPDPTDLLKLHTMMGVRFDIEKFTDEVFSDDNLERFFTEKFLPTFRTPSGDLRYSGMINVIVRMSGRKGPGFDRYNELMEKYSAVARGHILTEDNIHSYFDEAIDGDIASVLLSGFLDRAYREVEMLISFCNQHFPEHMEVLMRKLEKLFSSDALMETVRRRYINKLTQFVKQGDIGLSIIIDDYKATYEFLSNHPNLWPKGRFFLNEFSEALPSEAWDVKLEELLRALESEPSELLVNSIGTQGVSESKKIIFHKILWVLAQKRVSASMLLSATKALAESDYEA